MSQSSLSSSPTIVPLNRSTERTHDSHKQPVWPILASESGTSTPLAAKCARTTREDGVCCKELLKEERTLINPDVVRDV